MAVAKLSSPQYNISSVGIFTKANFSLLFIASGDFQPLAPNPAKALMNLPDARVALCSGNKI